MRLSDIHSQELLPRFAKDISWIMDALDSVIKEATESVKSLDAPLTLEAIQACTDEELEALYEQYGVAKYYPDLSRSTRDLMLYQMCRIYRYLGTPKALEILCNYIFDSLPLNITVLDNLAFDSDGNLVDSSLLDVFDVHVSPQDAVLDENANARILENIVRFSRNSQQLRDILYDFNETFNISVKYCVDSANPAVTTLCEQNTMCEPAVNPNVLEILLCICRGYGDEPLGVNMTPGNFYPSALISNEDIQVIQDFGLQYASTSYSGTYNAPYGTIIYDGSNFTYEVVALYSDAAGTVQIPTDPSNVPPGYYNFWYKELVIFCMNTQIDGVKTWKCRITKNS